MLSNDLFSSIKTTSCLILLRLVVVLLAELLISPFHIFNIGPRTSQYRHFVVASTEPRSVTFSATFDLSSLHYWPSVVASAMFIFLTMAARMNSPILAGWAGVAGPLQIGRCLSDAIVVLRSTSDAPGQITFQRTRRCVSIDHNRLLDQMRLQRFLG